MYGGASRQTSMDQKTFPLLNTYKYPENQLLLGIKTFGKGDEGKNTEPRSIIDTLSKLTGCAITGRHEAADRLDGLKNTRSKKKKYASIFAINENLHQPRIGAVLRRVDLRKLPAGASSAGAFSATAASAAAAATLVLRRFVGGGAEVSFTP
jgi:hypothetical protein